MGSMAVAFARLSPFRWRFEWAFILIAAFAWLMHVRALDEQYETPFVFHVHGERGEATVLAAREERRAPVLRSDVERVSTYLQIAVDDGARGRLERELYITPAMVESHGIDVRAGKWPKTVPVRYVRKLDGPPPEPRYVLVLRGPYGPRLQPMRFDIRETASCKTGDICFVTVLDARGYLEKHGQAVQVGLTVRYGSLVAELCALALLVLLVLRLAGVIDNKPTLE